MCDPRLSGHVYQVVTATAPLFPVTWGDPADAGSFGMCERHAPEPITLANAVAFHCAFDHGVTFADARHVDVAAVHAAAAVQDHPAT